MDLLPEAIESYEKVSQIEPLNDEIWFDYSDALKKSGNLDKAINVIQQGIDVQPENAGLCYRKANYLLLNKKLQEAYEVLEKALQMNYKKHCEFLEYDPSLLRNQQIIDLIELHKE
jgi:tetratricopeptide (TPR) repeat protein